MDPAAELEAQARLEQDYMAGRITADEYTQRRRALREGAPPAAVTPEVRFAGWGRRAAALLLDSTILLGAIVVEVAVAPDSYGIPSLVVVPALYAWLMVGTWGQTLGKMALGIRVVRAADAGRVGYARAGARVASVWLLALVTVPLLLAYLWPLWDPRKQTLYDKMAGTIVVHAGPSA